MSQRSGIPPWHLWGNTQRIVTTVETSSGTQRGRSGQMVKISYARPDTWHWLFFARLLEGPTNTAGQFTRVFVDFNLSTGIGRSAINLDDSNPPSDDASLFRPFEQYQFQWGPIDPLFPINPKIYSSSVQPPGRTYSQDGPVTTGTEINQIVAQDIQLVCRVIAVAGPLNLLALGRNVAVEVSAQFAPKTHIRPEWHEKRFPGAEDGAGTSVGEQVQQLNYPGTPLRRT